MFVQREGEGEEIYLLSGISASGDDGNTADLEDCKLNSQYL